MAAAAFRIEESRDIRTAQAIRFRVFTEEQGIAVADDLDGRDDAATHLLAWLGAEAIGTARILEAGRVGKIGRVAVLPEHRGQGFGRALVLRAVEVLAARPHIAEARLGAQVSAVPFYEALGFVPEGEVFMEAGLPHLEMVRPV